ncbi:hypothetical protein [Clostridium sp.]|uniref:hypothetical protein n=1 Tax=Clostridium sp. TaxID=1506 RepID=UPI003D6CC0AC
MLPLNGTYFANASLAEPMSCIIGAFHSSYHTKQYVYKHDMGIKEGGKVALLGGAGPMGLGAIEYAINGSIKPRLVVVVDIDDVRLNRAASLIKVEDAREKGVELIYLNTKDIDAVSKLMELSGGKGYDDAFVFAAGNQLIENDDDILCNDGCLNFFAGPTNSKFKVSFNFYKVHYEGTHIGGLNAAPETIKNLPNIPGGKKLIYPHIELELTAIEDFKKLGENNEFYKRLSEICKRNNNVWCEEAEKFLLETFKNK